MHELQLPYNFFMSILLFITTLIALTSHATATSTYRCPELNIILPSQYMYLGEEQFKTKKDDILQSSYCDLFNDAAVNIYKIETHHDLDDEAVIKRYLSRIFKDELQELKMTASVDDVMNALTIETHQFKTIYTLDQQMQNGSVINLRAVIVGCKLFCMTYHKANNGDAQYGKQLLQHMLEQL